MNKNKKLVCIFSIIFLFSIFFFLFSPVVFAQGNVWGQTLEILRGSKGVVPCDTSYAGRACTVCDIFVLIQNIINLLIFAAMSLGTLAALIIGIRFLVFGSNEKIIQQTRQQFNWLVWGIVVVLCSWLFLNTLFNFVASGSFKAWNKIECKVPSTPAVNGGASGTSSGLPGGGLPTGDDKPFQPGGGTFGGGGASGSWEVLDSPGYADGINKNTEGYTKYLNEPPEGNGLKTAEPGSAKPADYNKKIDEYVASATNLNGVEANRVKALIQAESSGNPLIPSRDIDGGSSYGLMQVRPETAKLYDPSVRGLSDYEIGQKLTNDNNYNIDIGTKRLSGLYKKYGDWDLAVAGYNGGEMANKPSVNCPGSYRWQCLYDNNEHTLLNERPGHPGYGPTRRDVRVTNQVYSQLSK